MFIYIDESGYFAYHTRSAYSYSCAGALTIPSRFHGQILKSFSRLKCRWGCSGHEPKGRELTEAQVASVVDLLLAGKARFHVCATDMAHNTPETILAYKHEQAARLMANVTDQHNTKLVHEIRDLQQKINSLSNQLFIQFCVMTHLVNKHLQDVVIHYALSDPPELGEFRWVIDRKEKSKTTYEDLWHTLLAPFIQSRQFSGGLDDRIVCVAEGDYSHFEKFCGQLNTWPQHLPPRREQKAEDKPIGTINGGKIIRESFTLGDSATSPGLQLTDIVTNAFRRAMYGRLQHSGWKDLGKMMFRWGDKAVHLIHFGNPAPWIPIDEGLPARVIIEMTRVAGNPLEG